MSIKKIPTSKLLRALNWQIKAHELYAEKCPKTKLRSTLFLIDCLIAVRDIVLNHKEVNS